MIRIKAKILEYSAGEFTDDTGRNVKYCTVVAQFGDKLAQLSSDIDLSSDIGKEGTYIAELRASSIKKPAKVVITGRVDK